MLDKNEIEKIIPQRDPFLMIDEIEEYSFEKCLIDLDNTFLDE